MLVRDSFKNSKTDEIPFLDIYEEEFLIYISDTSIYEKFHTAKHTISINIIVRA